MPIYFFRQKIKTVAQVWEPFEHNGYHFEAHNVDSAWGTQNGWIVAKEISADNVDAAYEDFYSRIYPIIDKLAFVTQCYTFIELEPYFIKRPDRPEFFLRHSKERRPVPLHFGPDELESVQALEKYAQRGDAFRPLREAINTSGFATRLVMLTSALEGIAGEIEKGKTDREYIETKILEDKELCNNIFQYTDGIRNQLLHGKKIDTALHGDTPYPEIIYQKIVEYFNKYHDTKINTDVKGAPRNIGGNYGVWSGWLKLRNDDAEVDFAQMCELDLHEATTAFESIQKPEDY